MTDFIKNLQEKPYATRMKILWGTVGVVTVLLIVIFVFNLKSAIKQTGGPTFNPTTPGANSEETSLKLATVERVEKDGTTLKVYFNFNNETDDILNLSKLEDITLKIKEGDLKPEQLTNRQGQTFVQKVLSHTQNFGILTFRNVSSASGTLVFDQMFFEKTPEQLFSQSLELDFNKLNSNNPVRN